MARVEMLPGAIDKLGDDMIVRYHATKAPVILQLMQTITPVDTGELRASGRVDRTIYRQGNDRVIRFWFDAAHAQIIFAGRGVVRPVRAKALRWVTKAGVVVFAQRSGPVAANRWTLRAFSALGFRDVKVGRR